jgi:hypothetical protein
VRLVGIEGYFWEIVRQSQIGMKSKLLLVLCLSVMWCCQTPDEPGTPQEPGPAVSGVKVIQDEIEGIGYVLAADLKVGYAVAFSRELNGQTLNFKPSAAAFPAVLQDQEGNVWDIFGYALSGPRRGSRLQAMRSTWGYFFAIAAMYPGATLVGGAPSQAPPHVYTPGEWLVDVRFLYRGSQTDAIPALDRPALQSYRPSFEKDSEYYVRDEDLVMAVRLGEQVRFYPYRLLHVHEIINDTLEGKPIMLTYAPFSGTTQVWGRELRPGQVSDFGFTGLLYNANSLPFDRETESIWLQLDGRCVQGPLRGKEIPIYNGVELPWGIVKGAFKNPQILAEPRIQGVNYRNNLYVGYRNQQAFPVAPVFFQDRRLQPKEKVFAVIVGNLSKIYPNSVLR